jgi:hypothetical protein
MPDIEIHVQPEAEKQEAGDIMLEVVGRLKLLPFAKSCKVSVVDTTSVSLKNDGKRDPFIRAYSIYKQRLVEIGEALKDLPFEIQFVKTAGYKPADSTEIKWSPNP